MGLLWPLLSNENESTGVGGPGGLAMRKNGKTQEDSKQGTTQSDSSSNLILAIMWEAAITLVCSFAGEEGK